MYRKTFILGMILALVVCLSSLAALAAPAIQEEGQAYTVQKDDNLWKIAEKYLGNGAAYPTIVAATKEKAAEDDTFAKILNPSVIHPGWKLWIPSEGEISGEVEASVEDSRISCEEEGDDTIKIVTCEFEEEDVIETASFEPIPVTNGQPLQLYVVGTEASNETRIRRTHFSLEIDSGDYPPLSFGDAFTLTVTAIPTKTIAADFTACQEYTPTCKYREVVSLTNDSHLIIGVDSGEYAGNRYVAANPYAFSVTGIVTFTNSVTVSISVDRPEQISRELWEQQEHGIIIHHENGGTTERFPVVLILDDDDKGFYRVMNSGPITRCCRAHADCSSGPACLRCE